jgi:hypothetical protein
MGKRSNFERKPRDFYSTPHDAILPLLRHIKGTFIEPCAGDGRLIRHLEKYGFKCVYACDIEPQPNDLKIVIETRDILFFGSASLPAADMIITNPPWTRKTLHPMIESFRRHAPTWLLFDADWMHNAEARPFLRFCRRIVSVGRVKWIEGSKNGGMDNACWYEFISDPPGHPPFFLPNFSPALSSEDERT